MSLEYDMINDKTLPYNGYAIKIQPISNDHMYKTVANEPQEENVSDSWCHSCCMFCLEVCYSWSRGTQSAQKSYQFAQTKYRNNQIILIDDRKSAFDEWVALFMGYFIGESGGDTHINANHTNDESNDDDDHKAGGGHHLTDDDDDEDGHEVLAVSRYKKPDSQTIETFFKTEQQCDDKQLRVILPNDTKSESSILDCPIYDQKYNKRWLLI